MAQFHKVTQAESGLKLDRWLKQKRPDIPFGLLQKLLRKGAIRIDGKRAKSDYKLQAGQEVKLPDVEQRKQKKKQTESIKISYAQAEEFIENHKIFENKHFIAINKPYGLPVQGGSGVKLSVDDYIRILSSDEMHLKLTHRIDKDTSGVLLIAKTQKGAVAATKAFKEREFQKNYLALVKGGVHPRQGTINAPLNIAGEFGTSEKTVIDEEDGKKAVTHYQVKEQLGKVTALLELEPETGRKHQIRAHLNEIEHPIIGDGKYGGAEAFIEGISNKLHLHAASLSHPSLIGAEISIKADLPEHMQETMKFLGI